MENTLDSIRPSENLEEMSYLFGRDPSILAYNQRPLPCKNTKKNLLSLYEVEENSATKVSENSENLSENSQHIQTIKVYLRLKPFPKKLKLTEDQQTAYEIVNSTTLVTKLPILDNNTSSVKQSKSTENICKKFIFSRTFGPETTQLEIFEQTVQQQMVDFLAGHNCTIMTYGTTNSGKSYTLQGTTTSPGLIPRALEFIFSNITARPNPLYKPLHYSDVISLSALDRAQELEAKTKLLTFSSVDKHQYMNSYKEMQKLLQEELIRPSECHDAHYSIWVSFAEIYNEIVYDLLSNECQKKRMPLKLGADSFGRAFIRGLKTVYVNSAAEAYQVLMAGQYNLKVAATALNAKSSRSHCIFTITLLKYYTEHQPDTVEVSTFSFCDLAGSERLKKTLNVGDRLKEAQNINTSLLVLGRCLKSIHEGQLTRTKPDTVGPFRESKLTRLFQRALSGREHLALIVNVNPLPNLYIETQNVLNFAAIAKKIVIEKKKEIQKKKTKSRFSQIVMQSMQTVTNWDSLELENVDSQHADIPEETTSDYLTSEEYTDILKENEKLRKEVVMLKNSALLRDFQSRQEMAEQYIAKINELEVDWKKRINDVEAQHEDDLEWTVKQLEEFYEKKLNQLRKRKRPRIDDDNEEDNNGHDLSLAELSEENAKLQEKNDMLKKSLSEFKVTNEMLIVEKNKSCFELGLLKEDLKVARSLLEAAQEDIRFNDDGKAFIEEMKSQLSTKDEQIKNLKNVLNEAKDEYITITSDLRKKELCIDEQAKTIVEQEEKIEDLELDLEQVNVCLAEKNRIVEILEEKLEHQNEKLSDNENKIMQLQEEINRLKNEKSMLRSSKTSKTSVRDEYEEIFIKEELLVGDISDNLNNVTKNMQKESKIDETDLIDLTFPLETSSKEIPESMDILQRNIERSKQTFFVEIGCQVDINNESIENKESTREEAAVQTDELSNDDVTKMEELTARYNDIQAQYERDRARVKELTEKLRDTEKTVQSLSEENQSNKTAVDEYKHSVQVLEQQLSLAAEDKQTAEEALSSSNTVFEQRIANYEREIVELKRDLSTARSNAQQSLDKFESMQKEFDNYILKCKEEANIQKPEDRVAADDINVKHLDELKEKILELEKSAETIGKLERHIDELNRNLKTCEMEKKCIQDTLEKNEKRLLELENRLTETVSKDQEKDVEIATLQRELKQSIQRYESAAKADDMMEAELKTAMSELTQTKEKLFRREQDIKELNIRLENFEKNAKFMNLFEETAKERQTENERLRNLNEELRTNLTHKEREMDAFMKNRDETVTKYEALVKNQQEDLERQKREVMRYQELFRRQLTPTPKDDYKKLQDRIEFLQDRLQKYEAGDNAKARDYYDVTSEDDGSIKSQKSKPRRGKKTASRVKQEDVPVVEFSESESKRNTRRAALPPPESSNDSKRTTRRRKLFVDDSLVDIEPVESNATTRTLRNRKK